MKKRLPTSVAILVVTLGFVLLRQFNLMFFDAFMVAIMFGSIFEVARIQKNQNNKICLWLLYIIPFFEFVVFNFVPAKYYLLASLSFALLSVLYLITDEIFCYAKARKLGAKQNADEINAHLFDKTKNTMMVFVYPVLPLSFLFLINHIGYDFGYIGIILTFAIAMLTDSFAYLIGCWLGKRRFIPEVSPKKSIAGVVGGFLGGLIGATAGFVLFYFTNWFPTFENIGMCKLICGFAVIGIIGAYANQLGDLIASAYKRKAGIKDFSNIFPGHGGFMDRVDGLMFVSVTIYIVIAFLFV